MDLINELKAIEEHDLPVENLLENLKEHQVILSKKIHILKVLSLSKAMIKLIDSQIHKSKISGINVSYDQYKDDCKFYIQIFDSQEKRIKMDLDFREKSKNVVQILKEHGKIDSNYVSEKFFNKRQGNIFFNKPVDDQIFDLFLNEELKKTLSYSQLYVKIKDKEENTKRPKI